MSVWDTLHLLKIHLKKRGVDELLAFKAEAERKEKELEEKKRELEAVDNYSRWIKHPDEDTLKTLLSEAGHSSLTVQHVQELNILCFILRALFKDLHHKIRWPKSHGKNPEDQHPLMSTFLAANMRKTMKNANLELGKASRLYTCLEQMIAGQRGSKEHSKRSTHQSNKAKGELKRSTAKIATAAASHTVSTEGHPKNVSKHTDKKTFKLHDSKSLKSSNAGSEHRNYRQHADVLTHEPDNNSEEISHASVKRKAAHHMKAASQTTWHTETQDCKFPKQSSPTSSENDIVKAEISSHWQNTPLSNCSKVSDLMGGQHLNWLQMGDPPIGCDVPDLPDEEYYLKNRDLENRDTTPKTSESIVLYVAEKLESEWRTLFKLLMEQCDVPPPDIKAMIAKIKGKHTDEHARAKEALLRWENANGGLDFGKLAKQLESMHQKQLASYIRTQIQRHIRSRYGGE